MSLACPTCHKRMKITPVMRGRKVKCPHCGCVIAVKPKPQDQQPITPPPKPTSPFDSAQGKPVESVPELTQPPQPPTKVTPPPPKPNTITAEPQAPHPSPKQTRPRGNTNPRLYRYKVTALVCLVPITLAWTPVAAFYEDGSTLTLIFFVLVALTFSGLWPLFLFGLHLDFWIARSITASSIKLLACPNCGETIPAEDTWDCSCGYHEHRTTNILNYRCGKCRAISDMINCPRCDTSILL